MIAILHPHAVSRTGHRRPMFAVLHPHAVLSTGHPGPMLAFTHLPPFHMPTIYTHEQQLSVLACYYLFNILLYSLLYLIIFKVTLYRTLFNVAMATVLKVRSRLSHWHISLSMPCKTDYTPSISIFRWLSKYSRTKIYHNNVILFILTIQPKYLILVS